jgi:hypothetical protein
MFCRIIRSTELHWLQVAHASSPLPATVADSDLRLFLFFDIFALRPPQDLKVAIIMAALIVRIPETDEQPL